MSKDIVELRYKHAQEKLLERINKVLRERRRMIREKYKEVKMQQMAADKLNGMYSYIYSPIV